MTINLLNMFDKVSRLVIAENQVLVAVLQLLATFMTSHQTYWDKLVPLGTEY